MENASLTIALAMGAGVLAQALAHHLRIPGIVLFLAIGVLLGPDFANAIRPAAAGSGLGAFVGFAVAIILFEGGLHMNFRKLRSEAKSIRRLVTIGALVTGSLASVAAKLFMGWPWTLSILFGTLVIVTGPTVITPLLRRLRVRPNISTILEAEGIFIDAVGATIAVVALNIVVSESALSVIGFATKIGVGIGVGLAGGALLALLFAKRRVIPHGLENIVALGLAVVIFQVSHAIEHESGITAAIVAGMVVSNTRSHVFDDLVHFKEQLVSLLIGTLFILLSADVRIDDVIALGVPGIATVVALMLVVRPITIAVSTYGTNLNLREKTFLSWLAPRGIVAAAVASLFAAELARKGIAGGTEMKALVFLVIAVTVTVQGLTGGILAWALRLRLPTDQGYAILGATPLGRALATCLASSGEQVVVIDSSRKSCEKAVSEGLEAVHGNGLDPRTMRMAMLGARTASIAMTNSENVNFLFAKKVHEEIGVGRVLVALETADTGVTPEMLEDEDARLLFGTECNLSVWSSRLGAKRATVETFELDENNSATVALPALSSDSALPLALCRRGKVLPVVASSTLEKGDQVFIVLYKHRRDEALDALKEVGLTASAGHIVDARATQPDTP